MFLLISGIMLHTIDATNHMNSTSNVTDSSGNHSTGSGNTTDPTNATSGNTTDPTNATSGHTTDHPNTTEAQTTQTTHPTTTHTATTTPQPVVTDDDTPLNADSTCPNGTKLHSCVNSTYSCILQCPAGHKMVVSDTQCVAAERTCMACPKDSWCDADGHVTTCPHGSTSPVSSNASSDCICHPGFTRNGTMCVECPSGSWCHASQKTTCPNGTSSKAMSKAETDCYCADAYTGAINCTTRSNQSHAPCHSGYARPIEAKNLKKWGCVKCQAGSWCDGADTHTCPSGMTTNPGNSDKEKCSCYEGYTRSQCLSVVSFNVTLQMSFAAFNAEKQIDYKNVLAGYLNIPTTSIVVEVLTTGAQRRLLSPTIKVENRATVPDEKAATIKAAYSSETLTTSLLQGGFTGAEASAARVTSSRVLVVAETSTDGMSTWLIIVIIAGSVLAAVAVLVMCNRKTHTPEYTKLQDSRAPATSTRALDEPNQPSQDETDKLQFQTVSLKTDGFMKRRPNIV
jgi:hypothetical protein